MDDRHTPTLVVLRALKVGDLLTAVPALRALCRAFPDHRRLLATPAGLARLVALAGTGHTVVPTGEHDPLAAELHGADVAVNLHGKGPQSTERLRATDPRRLIAFGVTARWRAGEHERERWCRLLAEAGIAADSADLEIVRPSPSSGPGRPGAIVLHPGASSPARRWPPQRWAHVARSLAERGHRVAITGSADERRLATAIARAAAHRDVGVLAGHTDLTELAQVVAHARLVVCGDTGVAHLASAFAAPSVVLFGPTPPSEWGPPADPRHIVLWAGERGDPMGSIVHHGLLRLDVATVSTAIDRLIALTQSETNIA